MISITDYHKTNSLYIHAICLIPMHKGRVQRLILRTIALEIRHYFVDFFIPKYSALL